jgi:hypothetical protein
MAIVIYPPEVEAVDISGKVDKITGKGLSTNDFTTTLKNKVDGIEANANNYVHPTTDGNKHLPANGTTNAGKVVTASAEAGVFTLETPSGGKTVERYSRSLVGLPIASFTTLGDSASNIVSTRSIYMTTAASSWDGKFIGVSYDDNIDACDIAGEPSLLASILFANYNLHIGTAKFAAVLGSIYAGAGEGYDWMPNNKHCGFTLEMVSNVATLYASCANGSSNTKVSLGVKDLSAGNGGYLAKMYVKLTAADAKFYINNILVATITTNLPTQYNLAIMCSAGVVSLSNNAQYMTIRKFVYSQNVLDI